MLNLRTKGIENAAAVLGGYDAMVKAGFAVETGDPATAQTVQQPNAPAPGANNPNDSATVVTSNKTTAAQNSNQAAAQKSTQPSRPAQKRKRHRRSKARRG